MTDDYTTRTTRTETPTGDDSFAWSEPEPTTSDAGAKGREWLAQLQSMIENLATQAAPVAREVGAKAAELAALAGEKAGPVAQRAAEVTGKAGEKLAAKSRDLAAEWRRDAAAGKAGTETAGDIAESATADATDAGIADEQTPTTVA